MQLKTWPPLFPSISESSLLNSSRALLLAVTTSLGSGCMSRVGLGRVRTIATGSSLLSFVMLFSYELRADKGFSAALSGVPSSYTTAKHPLPRIHNLLDSLAVDINLFQFFNKALFIVYGMLLRSHFLFD